MASKLHENKREKKSFFSRIGERWGMESFPEEAPFLILEGKRTLRVRGCRRILHYSPETIRLLVGRECLCVHGDGMLCRSFSSGVITLGGCIRSVGYVPLETVTSEKEGKE